MTSAIANAWLRPEPGTLPVRQVLVGDAFAVDTRRDGWAHGRAGKDGYEGWLPEEALGPAIDPTHRVGVRSTWAFAAPDVRAEALVDLHMTSPVEVEGVRDGWARIRLGDGSAHVPVAHLRPRDRPARDPVAVARSFLGTPYLWAGNTGFGLDCSGLVQAVLIACGLGCPADSHEQEAMEGARPAADAAPAAGDLVFWRGHVAMVSGENAILHANAHHMAVVEEPMEAALARIEATDTGAVTSRLRPLWPGSR